MHNLVMLAFYYPVSALVDATAFQLSNVCN